MIISHLCEIRLFLNKLIVDVVASHVNMSISTNLVVGTLALVEKRLQVAVDTPAVGTLGSGRRRVILAENDLSGTIATTVAVASRAMGLSATSVTAAVFSGILDFFPVFSGLDGIVVPGATIASLAVNLRSGTINGTGTDHEEGAGNKERLEVHFAMS